ncbi:MAG: hypothetical protein ABI988_09380 [Nitrospirota bacterium]
MYIREPTYRSLGQSPGLFEGIFNGTIRGDSAEVVPLTKELIKYSQEEKWASVDRTYKMLESMGNEALAGCGKTLAFSYSLVYLSITS